MYPHCIYYLEEEDHGNSRCSLWGNSLALRIPKPLASQIGLELNSPVELSLRGKELRHLNLPKAVWLEVGRSFSLK